MRLGGLERQKWAYAIGGQYGLTPSEQAVLLAMTVHANFDTGADCYPSVGTLATKTKFSDKTVRRALKGLVAKELIAVTGQKPTSSGSTNVYRIAYELNPARDSAKRKGDAQPEEHGGQGDRGHQDQGLPQQGHDDSHPRHGAPGVGESATSMAGHGDQQPPPSKTTPPEKTPPQSTPSGPEILNSQTEVPKGGKTVRIKRTAVVGDQKPRAPRKLRAREALALIAELRPKEPAARKLYRYLLVPGSVVPRHFVVRALESLGIAEETLEELVPYLDLKEYTEKEGYEQPTPHIGVPDKSPRDYRRR